MNAAISQVSQKQTAAPSMLVPPYPGLRPFQPEDAEYFFGRGDSIREVVRRLRSERFVAVIGGSGSGKSSLVLAGAIPRLRSFGLDDTGDFWVSIVSTPGTNPIDGETPVQRLAGKFCGQLRAPEGETSQQRLKACSDLLREPGGLGKLVDRYGSKVSDLDGVDPENLKVNYLFLLDQFEELFHRSNRGKQVADDCAHLVARIVEQSKPEHRHANVCIALTMRSEHLNDCPRYKDLPDAINRAFYLVGRLDAAQISQAIQQPALRYLRNCIAVERQARPEVNVPEESYAETKWPDGVEFDPYLMQRIQRDASAVLGERDHADQLPLLQHLLFWIWDAACKRCAGATVPDGLNIEDLKHAVNPSLASTDVGITEDSNVLKVCLENHCERIYGLHEHTQNDWKLVFRSLAFKEPNTGAYTQHRASMKALSERLGLSQDTNYDALGVLLQPWIHPHGYLHWDTDSWTVKVAHETLIRRWKKFRTWTDQDDRQFQLYLRLRDESHEWSEASEVEKTRFLASGNALLLYENMQISSALSDRDRSSQLQSLLEMDRDGRKLAQFKDNTKEFLDASLAYRYDLEQSAASALAWSRRYQFFYRYVLLWVGILITIGLALSEVSQKELILHRGYALAAETQANVRSQIGEYDQPQFALLSSIHAANFFHDNQSQSTPVANTLFAIGDALKLNIAPDGNESKLRDFFRWINSLVNWFGIRLNALVNAELLTEARASGSLRKVLVGVPWTLTEKSSDMPKPKFVDCQIEGIDEAKYIPMLGAADGTGLVLAKRNSWGYGVYMASMSKGNPGHCSIRDAFFEVPNGSGVKGVGIDAALQNIVVSFDTYTQYHVVNWDDPLVPHLDPRAVVYVGGAPEGIHGLPSRRSEFATDIAVGQQVVRLFDVNPGPVDQAITRVVLKVPESKIVDLKNENSICSAFVLGKELRENEKVYGLDPSSTAKSQNDKRAVCLIVKEAYVGKGVLYVGEIFVFADMDAAKDKDKRLPVFENIVFGSKSPLDIRINRTEGWLAFRTEKEGAWRAIPWTLDAWRCEAKRVFRRDVAENIKRHSQLPELSRPYLLIMSDVEKEPTRERLMDQLPCASSGATTVDSAMPKTITQASIDKSVAH
jgi:hypothetical protein